MYIKEDNMIIRNATAEDSKILCDWWNDGQVMAHAGFPNGLGITQQSVIDKIANDNDDISRRLILEINTLPVGEMSYRNIGNNFAEIGIKICNFEKQEKGFGTQFIKMLIKELLFNMDYNKIILDTNLNNERAQHVYEKIGFRKVGIRVNSWKNQLGELQSCVDYEMTREDFIV